MHNISVKVRYGNVTECNLISITYEMIIKLSCMILGIDKMYICPFDIYSKIIWCDEYIAICIHNEVAFWLKYMEVSLQFLSNIVFNNLNYIISNSSLCRTTASLFGEELNKNPWDSSVCGLFYITCWKYYYFLPILCEQQHMWSYWVSSLIL